MNSLLCQKQAKLEGVASVSYFARDTELKPSIMKVEELIREIATAHDFAARIVEEDQ